MIEEVVSEFQITMVTRHLGALKEGWAQEVMVRVPGLEAAVQEVVEPAREWGEAQGARVVLGQALQVRGGTLATEQLHHVQDSDH